MKLNLDGHPMTAGLHKELRELGVDTRYRDGDLVVTGTGSTEPPPLPTEPDDPPEFRRAKTRILGVFVAWGITAFTAGFLAGVAI